MAKRKIYEDSEGSKTVKVYWDSDWQEYSYVLYQNGKEQGSGFADDKNDAIQSAQHILRSGLASAHSKGGMRNNPAGGIEAILETYGNILATDGYNVICRKKRAMDHSEFDIVEIHTGKVVKHVALNNFDFNSIMGILSEELDLKSPLEEDYDDDEE